MHRGMTGTRTPDDKLKMDAAIWLSRLDPDSDWIVTGACVGMDEYVTVLAHMMGFRVHLVVPANRKQVMENWEQYATTYTIMAPKTTYRERNIKIVEISDTLAVFAQYPEDDDRSKRSGTWQTYRIAVARRVPYQLYLSDQES